MYPVAKFNGKWKTRDWTKAKWYPSVANGNRIRSKWVNPESFFDTLREVLEEVPPLPNEVDLYARLKDLLDRSKNDVELRDQLATVAHQTEREYIRPLFEFQHNGIPLENGWRTLVNGAAFGSDYVTRTAVARSNIFVNRPTEAMYYYLDHGAQGERLKGDRAYKLTFPADRLPPARGFWSLTLYDQDHHLYLNPDERYAVGTRSHDLVWNDDGSLTIYVQPEAPESGKMSNWLPSRRANFLFIFGSIGLNRVRLQENGLLRSHIPRRPFVWPKPMRSRGKPPKDFSTFFFVPGLFELTADFASL